MRKFPNFLIFLELTFHISLISSVERPMKINKCEIKEKIFCKFADMFERGWKGIRATNLFHLPRTSPDSSREINRQEHLSTCSNVLP